jgi:hypothetical protein
MAVMVSMTVAVRDLTLAGELRRDWDTLFGRRGSGCSWRLVIGVADGERRCPWDREDLTEGPGLTGWSKWSSELATAAGDLGCRYAWDFDDLTDLAGICGCSSWGAVVVLEVGVAELECKWGEMEDLAGNTELCGRGSELTKRVESCFTDVSSSSAMSNEGIDELGVL